jgi:hypothetical protein
LSIIKKLEKELNETYSLKNLYPPFPLEIRLPYSLRKGSAVFYQKGKGFRIWGPNHYTRASLVTQVVPNYGGVDSAKSDPPIRTPASGTSPNWDMCYWNIRVGDGTGTTSKSDTTLKASTTYQADDGTSARIDAGPQYYQRQYSAVYNALTLPPGYTIREVGLFFRCLMDQTISGQSFTAGVEYMVARLSTSDGDFTAYTVNNTLPLTVNWIIQWSL